LYTVCVHLEKECFDISDERNELAMAVNISPACTPQDINKAASSQHKESECT